MNTEPGVGRMGNGCSTARAGVSPPLAGSFTLGPSALKGHAMTTSDWYSFIVSLLWNLPFVMIYVIGIMLSLVFWQRHPMVSTLSLVAFLILLGNIVIGSGLQLWVTGAFNRTRSSPYSGRGSGENIEQVMRIVGIFRTLLGMAAWSLLLTALFGWRSKGETSEKGVT